MNKKAKKYAREKPMRKTDVETEIIEGPYVYWGGKWRRGSLAIIIRNHLFGDKAWVHVTKNQIVSMPIREVYRNSEEVAKLQKKYARGGWVVDTAGVVHEVYLDLLIQDGAGSFVFRTEKSRGHDYLRTWSHNCWRVEALENAKKWKRNDSAQFFTKESAALRYAIRMQKRRLVPAQKRVDDDRKELEELRDRLAKVGGSE